MGALAACGPVGTGQQVDGPSPGTQAIGFDGAAASRIADRVAHGDRLASVLGCRGCHGATLQGQRFGEVYASNLTRDVPNYTDTQLRQLLREGVHPTGRDVWGMPSELFQYLGDNDLAAIVSFLRTLAPAGDPTQPRLPWTEESAKDIASGLWKPAAATVLSDKGLEPADLGPSHALGRYITMVTCSECHGPTLEGHDDTPDLIVASAYSREEFERLMTKGEPNQPRKLRLMDEVARGRFAKLTVHERDALYAFLKARAGHPG